jgi:hypothetical protein
MMTAEEILETVKREMLCLEARRTKLHGDLEFVEREIADRQAAARVIERVIGTAGRQGAEVPAVQRARPPSQRDVAKQLLEEVSPRGLTSHEVHNALRQRGYPNIAFNTVSSLLSALKKDRDIHHEGRLFFRFLPASATAPVALNLAWPVGPESSAGGSAEDDPEALDTEKGYGAAA